MNKRNKELYLKSVDEQGEFCYQSFAELIRQDERDKCAQDYLQDCVDAVEAARLEEREANAKLAEITCCKCMDTAEAIRQRGEK